MTCVHRMLAAMALALVCALVAPSVSATQLSIPRPEASGCHGPCE